MTDDVWERGFALAEGRIPPGIDPKSTLGKHYARLAATIKADVDAAPPMTAAQRRTIVTLLRGGDQRAAAS